MSLIDAISRICTSPSALWKHDSQFKITVHCTGSHRDENRGAFTSWKTRYCLDLVWTDIRSLSSSTYCLLSSPSQPAWENASFRRAAVIWTRATAGMNASDESSYHGEVLLGNSTWDYSYYHQNYTLAPPLLADKTSTSKPAACEQVHIAIEVSDELQLQLCSPLLNH